MAYLDSKRYNRAKAQVQEKHRSQFATGQRVATARENPMRSNPKPYHHTTDGKSDNDAQGEQ